MHSLKEVASAVMVLPVLSIVSPSGVELDRHYGVPYLPDAFPYPYPLLLTILTPASI